MVTEVSVVLQCEGEFTVNERFVRVRGLVEPEKEESPGEEAAVESEHDLGVFDVVVVDEGGGEGWIMGYGLGLGLRRRGGSGEEVVEVVLCCKASHYPW